MLSTLLLILKIICIAVLVILGLVLTVLFLVLFVPARYRFWCSCKEGVSAEAKITWLFHLLSVLVTYGQSLKVSVKVLGIPLGGSKKGGEDDGTEEDWEENADTDTGNEDGRSRREDNSPDGGWETDRGKGLAGDTFASGNMEQNVFDEPDDDFGESPVSGNQVDGGRKISKGDRPAAIRFSLHRILRKIKFRFQALCGKVKEVEDKGKWFHGFLTDKANQKSFRQMLRIIKHILPRKLTGSVEFGFEDPSVTGQVTALCSFAYARYGNALQITPVFDEQVLEALVKGKGRIFLGVVLFWCLRILMNQNIRRLIFKRQLRKDGGK